MEDAPTTNSFYDTPEEGDKIVLYPHLKVMDTSNININIPEELSTEHFRLQEYISMFSENKTIGVEQRSSGGNTI